METTIKPVFKKGSGTDIYARLRREATKLVEQLEPLRRNTILFKAFLFPLAYCATWLLALVFAPSPGVYYFCFFLLGIQLVFIFLNIIHDAVHGTLFKGKKANRIMVYLFDLMGANSFIWRQRHIRFHHNYPNVLGWDTDVDQSRLFRLFPSAPHYPMNRYQHLYLPLVYPLFLFNWLLLRDFRDFFNKRKMVHKLIRIPAAEYVKLMFFKVFFLAYTLFIPKFGAGIPWRQAIAGFVVMVLTASVFSLITLLPPHANTENKFPIPDEKNEMPEDWFMHMLETTNDVKESNGFTRFFLGNFNFHVVHHLFPQINHVYYPELTHLLEKYASEYHLPYRKYPLFRTLANHYRLVRQNRVSVNALFGETM